MQHNFFDRTKFYQSGFYFFSLYSFLIVTAVLCFLFEIELWNRMENHQIKDKSFLLRLVIYIQVLAAEVYQQIFNLVPAWPANLYLFKRWPWLEFCSRRVFYSCRIANGFKAFLLLHRLKIIWFPSAHAGTKNQERWRTTWV